MASGYLGEGEDAEGQVSGLRLRKADPSLRASLRSTASFRPTVVGVPDDVKGKRHVGNTVV
jgi:hypothetical protein